VGGFVSAGYEVPSIAINVGTNYAKVSSALSGASASHGLALTSSLTDQTWVKRLINSWVSRIVVGFALKLTVVPNATLGLQVFEIAPNRAIVILPDLYVQAFGVKTNFQVEVGVWYFIEVRFDALGKLGLWIANNKVAEFDIDPATQIQYMHIMAKALGTAGAQSAILHVDDLYILDGSGTVHTDRLGRTNSILRIPTANVESGFTSYSGTVPNYDAINETYSLGDSDYVYANTAVQDLYSTATLLNTQKEIKAVSIITTSRKEEPDPLTVAPILKSGATQVDGTGYNLRASVYTTNSQTFEVDPATSQIWTKAAVEAVQWGQKIIVGTPQDFPTVTGSV
jgi:hypothetical protein